MKWKKEIRIERRHPFRVYDENILKSLLTFCRKTVLNSDSS
jgi:hypothetical protein